MENLRNDYEDQTEKLVEGSVDIPVADVDAIPELARPADELRTFDDDFLQFDSDVGANEEETWEAA